MTRYILTGMPGCGKTSIIEELKTLGHYVVEESATDVIAKEQALKNLKPWESPEFIEKIVALQKYRQEKANCLSLSLEFYDRSPVCTYALSLYLGFEPSNSLMNEIERIKKNYIYNERVFFIENLGFIKNTDARTISFEESLKFEKIHLDSYAKFGFECLQVPVLQPIERAEFILKLVSI